MRFEKETKLRDGTVLVLRSLEKRDAAAAVWLLGQINAQTEFLMREPGEGAVTIAQEEAFINGVNESAREVLIGAFIAGQQVGMANLSQISPRIRTRHRATVGISLIKTYWGRGIGGLMMDALADCAMQAGYEQIELEVVAENERAVRLYERRGFETVGRMPRAMKYRDGRYADFLIMRRVL